MDHSRLKHDGAPESKILSGVPRGSVRPTSRSRPELQPIRWQWERIPKPGLILSKTYADSLDLIIVTFTNKSPPATYSIRTTAMTTENVQWALVEFVGHGIRLGVGVIESRPGWDFAEEWQQSRIRRLQIPLIVNHIEPISNIGLKITLLTPSALCQIAVTGNLEQFSIF